MNQLPELRVESEYLYMAPNSLISHNGAGRWFTGAGKAVFSRRLKVFSDNSGVRSEGGRLVLYQLRSK